MNTVKLMNLKTGHVEHVKIFSGSSHGLYGMYKNKRTSKPTLAQLESHALKHGYVRIGTRKNKGRRSDFNT